jgi:antitoxin component YwqK of YwqJK toxin-antitoxin module
MSRHDHGPQFNAGKRAGIVTGCALSATLLSLLILVSWVTDDVDLSTNRFVREYHSTGPLRAEGLIIGDKRSGLWTFRHSNGRIAAQGLYGNGAALGGWSYWYDDGTLRAVGCFQHGSFGGEWTFYDRDGKKRAEATFSLGQPVSWRRYSADGSSEQQPLPMFPDEPELLREFQNGDSQ